MSRMRALAVMVAILALGLLLYGCSTPQGQVVTVEVPVEVTKVVEKVVTVQVPIEVTKVVEKVETVEVPAEPSGDIPFAAAWISSGHADTQAEAFNHWNEDSPPEIPTSCAKCHSTPGYRDFLGADGTTAGEVNNPAPIGTVITCIACHNEATLHLTSVVFPSGVEVTGLGPEARCMVCHQGRASTETVNAGIEKAGVTDPDAVSQDLSFTNIHYFAAAATLEGSVVMGGYQYEGQSYDPKFTHVQGVDSCIKCHNEHSLQIQLATCQGCHTNVQTVADLHNIRMNGSLQDYDGNGNITEGIYYEVEGMRNALYKGMQQYAKDVAGTAILYDPNAYPYFFVDTNGNGQADSGEAVASNGYKSWTVRLVKAAYNLHTSVKDPGAFAHNAKYVIELLYDSLADLNSALPNPIDMSAMHRIDTPHFAGSTEPFRHWDSEGEVPGSCSRCHSSLGLPLYLEQGVTINEPTANGFLCTTCHENLSDYAVRPASTVTFPSGAKIDSGDPLTNLCMDCHQGRESSVSVTRSTAGLPDDQVSNLRFLNIHYLAAGATLFGTEAMGAYQYPGQTYVGRNLHVPAFDDCEKCHDVHAQTVKVEACAQCHTGVTSEADLRTAIRMNASDYDGDGDTNEGVGQEISDLHEKLLLAMQAYATQVVGTGITYDGNRYPYFFAADGSQYASWTPRLLKAAYNYQYVAKDPGAFAHNAKYVAQVMYDSITDLATQAQIDTTGLVRPTGQ